MATSSSATDLLADPLLRDVPVLEGHKVLAGVALYAKVGQGGMGVVYRGRHCLLDIDMAVKVLKPSLVAEDERFALRFRREAQVAAHITHQNVIRLYEANQQHGLHYLLMEFVDGESARGRVQRKGRLPEPEALGILLGAASGVAEAHRAGVVHRDIKPENMLVARDGRVKVADLGLVKRDDGHADGVTRTSDIMGTPEYMAPEQWDSPDVTPAADVWALGATLWYLLVGEHAIEFTSLAATSRRVQEQDFPSLRQARPDLRVEVHELFERCMHRRSDARFADARALVEALLPLVRGGEETLADPEAGFGGSRPSLPTPPPRATIERIRDALGTGTRLADSRSQRSEAATIPSKKKRKPTRKAKAPHAAAVEQAPDRAPAPEAPAAVAPATDAASAVAAARVAAGAPASRFSRGGAVIAVIAVALGIAAGVTGFGGPRDWIASWFAPSPGSQRQPTEPATDEMLRTGVGIVMHPIPVRTFAMGSPANAPGHRGDESQHDVVMTKPFWLGETEVTRVQWVRVMDTTPWLDERDPAPGDEPAVRISWTMAREFCERLTRSEQAAKRLPDGYVYCLPSEAQWELAAQGGGLRTWPHGDDATQLAQHAVFARAVGFADPVATRKANPFGLFDLAGNADEWCEDRVNAGANGVFALAIGKATADPLFVAGPLCAYRGGNYGSKAADCRVAARFAAPPETARDTLGFRVALAKR